MKCLLCNKQAVTTKYLVIPGYIMLPNIYDLCEDHKDIWLKYEDLYDENGRRKKIEFKI